jgi:hypothetical protein
VIVKPADFVFNGKMIPDRMCYALERYIEHHIRPGDFLQAVISNNLKEACGRADDVNVELLHVYVAYLYNEAPSSSWGSKLLLDAWCGLEWTDPDNGPYCSLCFDKQATWKGPSSLVSVVVSQGPKRGYYCDSCVGSVGSEEHCVRLKKEVKEIKERP